MKNIISICIFCFSMCIPSFSFADTLTDASTSLNIPPVSKEEARDSVNYKKLQSMKGKSSRRGLSEEMKAMRPKAIMESAQRLGVQEGYMWRYLQIKTILEKTELMLDSIFDFGPLLLHERTVMPPVIQQADASTEISSAASMVRVGNSYKILRPARFVSVEPSWRDYLLVPENAIRVERVHPGMLPTNSDEQKVWKQGADEGWLAGIEHADNMFQRGVNKLMVDMRGIIQYHVLEQRGYIAMPQVSKGHYDIRVGNENLEFNQEIFRITENSRFKNKETVKPARKTKKKN